MKSGDLAIPTQFPDQVRVKSLGVGNAAVGSIPGTIVKRIEVFDENGTSLGFIPVYDNIM